MQMYWIWSELSFYQILGITTYITYTANSYKIALQLLITHYLVIRTTKTMRWKNNNKKNQHTEFKLLDASVHKFSQFAQLNTLI